MEPPAKPLRILQSVEVDETNPEYVNAKQKQQRKFKGRLESIFAKYENMHESMSDEIDMRENKVVVDRGHLRRLARQVNRKETVLLDNLGLQAGREPEVEQEAENEMEDEDSEDELAPTQVSKSSRKETQHQTEAPAENGATSSLQNTEDSAIQPQHPLVRQSSVQLLANTPNPAADLLQFVQFPQTPAGQEAQTSFYASLAQTINQAVQRTVVPLFATILPNTPNLQLPAGSPFGTFATPVPNNDRIAPASDPKWFFPPLSAEVYSPHKSQTIARPASSRYFISGEQDASEKQGTAQLEEVGQETTIEIDECLSEPSFPGTAIVRSCQQMDTPPKRANRQTSARVKAEQKRSRPAATYQFSEADDIYISKQRTLQKKTWTEIKDAKEGWKDWPVHIIQQRWYKQLKTKDLHLRYATPLQAEQDYSALSEDEIAHSFGQEDTFEDVAGETPLAVAYVISSSTHFDDDECELLSLADADIEEEQSLDSVEEETSFLDADEVVVPCVESNDFINEDTLPQGLLEGSPLAEVARHSTVNIKTKVVENSPTMKGKRTQAPKAYQAVPDFNAEEDLVDAIATPEPPVHHALACDICGTAFKTAKNLRRHQANPRSTHDKHRPRSASASIDLLGDDELQTAAPATPHIKVYLKQVKQSWAKRAKPAPQAAYKRRSFHTVPRKRSWSSGSDDELGM